MVFWKSKRLPDSWWPLAVVTILLEAYLGFFVLVFAYEAIGLKSRFVALVVTLLPPMLHLRIPEQLPLPSLWRWPVGWVVITVLMIPYYFVMMYADELIGRLNG